MAVNIYATLTTNNITSKQNLLLWINETLGTDYQKVEDLSNGVAYCKLFEKIFPGIISFSSIKSNPRLEHEKLSNIKILQNAFETMSINEIIPMERLAKGRLKDNLEFLQWYHKFFQANSIKTEASLGEDKILRNVDSITRDRTENSIPGTIPKPPLSLQTADRTGLSEENSKVATTKVKGLDGSFKSFENISTQNKDSTKILPELETGGAHFAYSLDHAPVLGNGKKMSGNGQLLGKKGNIPSKDSDLEGEHYAQELELMQKSVAGLNLNDSAKSSTDKSFPPPQFTGLPVPTDSCHNIDYKAEVERLRVSVEALKTEKNMKLATLRNIERYCRKSKLTEFQPMANKILNILYFSDKEDDDDN